MGTPDDDDNYLNDMDMYWRFQGLRSGIKKDGTDEYINKTLYLFVV